MSSKTDKQSRVSIEMTTSNGVTEVKVTLRNVNFTLTRDGTTLRVFNASAHVWLGGLDADVEAVVFGEIEQTKVEIDRRGIPF
jgi:hypothetical protein